MDSSESTFDLVAELEELLILGMIPGTGTPISKVFVPNDAKACLPNALDSGYNNVSGSDDGNQLQEYEDQQSCAC